MRTPRTDPVSVLNFFFNHVIFHGCFIVSAFPVKGHTAQKFRNAVIGTKAEVAKDT